MVTAAVQQEAPLRDREREDMNEEKNIPTGPTGIGERIRIARREKGINQTVLAESVELERSAVSNWEQGRTSPSLAMVHTLSRVLDVDLMWLAFGKNMTEATDGSVIPHYEVDEAGKLVHRCDEYVSKKYLVKSTGECFPIDTAIMMTTTTADDLGAAGQVALIDTANKTPGYSPATFAVARNGGWYAARLVSDPVEDGMIQMFSETLRIDKSVEAKSLHIIGHVESIFHRRIS